MNRIQKHNAVAICAAVSAIMASPAYSAGIEEIIVTAERREQAASDVSIAISNFSGDEMKNFGIIDTTDLSRAVPGFTFAESGFNVPIYTIRGIGLNETSYTATSTVAVYRDQINLPYPIMTRGANLDMERVEILKGPQGTLFGRNTTGGVVNYIASKPTDELDLGFSTTYERFDKYTVEGFVSGPLADTLQARFAYKTVQANEGWQKSYTRPGDDLGEEDRQAARLIVEWQPSDDVSVDFSVDWWRDKSDSQAAQAVGFDPQNTLLAQAVGLDALFPEVRNQPIIPANTSDIRAADWATDYPWRLNDEFVMASLKLSWNLSEKMSLDYIGTYQEYTSDNASITSTGLVTLNAEHTFDAEIESFSHELRLSGTTEGDINWTAGVFYSSDDVTENRDLIGPTNSNNIVDLATWTAMPGVIFQDYDQEAETRAAFVNADFPLAGDMWSLSVGARYTEESRDLSGCTGELPTDLPGRISTSDFFNMLSGMLGGNGGAAVGKCFTLVDGTPGMVTDSLDEDNVSGRVALNWKPNDDTLFYLSYARGFKSGNFSTPSAATNNQTMPAEQEQLDAIELGGKMYLMDNRVRLNFALFDYDYKDKQLLGNLLDPVFGVQTVLANIPKSKVRGGEFDILLVPVDRLNITLAATMLDTEIKEYVGLTELGQNVDFSGNSFNFTPELQYFVALNYTMPLASSGFNLTLGGDYSYSDDTNAELSENPDFAIDDYALLNLWAKVSPQDERWSVRLWGKNVTDEYYLSNVIARGDTIARFTGRPTTYGITFEWSLQ